MAFDVNKCPTFGELGLDRYEYKVLVCTAYVRNAIIPSPYFWIKLLDQTNEGLTALNIGIPAVKINYDSMGDPYPMGYLDGYIDFSTWTSSSMPTDVMIKAESYTIFNDHLGSTPGIIHVYGFYDALEESNALGYTEYSSINASRLTSIYD